MAFKAKMIGREALQKKLSAVAPSIEKGYAAGLEQGAHDLADAVKARAPRGEDGQYATEIEAAKLSSRPEGKTPVGINSTKDPHAWALFAPWYWRFVEFGTRAHDILARKVPHLVFRGANGALVAIKKVRHPGATRIPHIFPVYRAMKKRIRARVIRGINAEVRKLKGR